MTALASENLPIDIYARVSKKRAKKPRRGDREMSTAGQVVVCRERLADLGLPEGEVLIEPGRSAWNPKVKRPQWDALMERLEGGASGGVIIFDLERFTRQPEDGERLIKLANRGLKVLDSESEYDLTTPNGKKNFRDALAAAAYYSDRLSTRVQRGLKLRALDGEPHGGMRPFGFEADGVTQRESEACELADATARALAGEPQKSIVEDWAARGIRSSRGRLYTETMMRQLLTRQRNCGRIIRTDPATGETRVVGQLPGEPIVSEEDFDRLTAIYAGRRRGRPNSPIYLCSALAVAEDCGKPMYGRPRTDLAAYPDGLVRRHYWCATVVGGCMKSSIDQRLLDEAAAALTVAMLSDPRHAAAIEAAAREIAGEAFRLDAEIADAEAVADALADKLGRGEMPLSRFEVATRPLDRRIAKLRAERAALGSPDSMPSPQRGTREHWQRRWADAGPEQRRDLLKKALQGKHLVIAPGRAALSSDLDSVMRRITVA